MMKIILSSAFVIALCLMHQAQTCNEAVCGSIVSKCLLTQACKCDLKNCTCCKDCFNCLSYLYSECCSCVDMCPKPNDTHTHNGLSTKSHVEDFSEPLPALFKILTEVPDIENRWNATIFPVDIEINQYSPKNKDIKIQMQSAEQEVAPIKSNVITLNCTVAFLTKCMGWIKCKKSCQSMGASSYRWFHDACCECIGENCINYGINESRCHQCPEKGEDIQDEFDDDFDSAAYDFESETNE